MLHNVPNRQILLSVLLILDSSTLLSQVNIKERVEIRPLAPVRNATTQSLPPGTLFMPLGDPGQPFVQTYHPCTITATCTLPAYDPVYNIPTDFIALTLMGAGTPHPEYWLGTSNASDMSTPPVTLTAPSCATLYVYRYVGQMGDLSGCVVSVTPTTVLFELSGTWRRKPINATVTLTAVPDTTYDLATLGISASPSSITQCYDATAIVITATDNLGQNYSDISCNETEQMTVSVPATSKATLEYPFNMDSVVRGKSLTRRAGYMLMYLRTNYEAGDPPSDIVVTVTCQDKIAQATVHLLIDPAASYLSADVSPGEVRYNMKSLINARLLDGCGKTQIPPTTTTFKFEITDYPQFGYLYDPATGSAGTVLEGVRHVQGVANVEYRAYGEEPPEEEDIPLLISISDESVGPFQTDIYVEPNKLRVTAAPNPIHFGESTQWTVEKKERDGTYTTIPSNWQTAFQLVEVDTNGYLYSPDSTQIGSTVYGAFQTASYYAKPRQAEPDSASVSIFVTTVDPDVILSKVNDGKKPKAGLGANKTKSVATKGMKQTGQKNIIAMDDPPHLGGGQPYYGAGRVVVKKMEEGLDHFKVTLEKDTIAFTETSKIFVQAKDAKDADIELDPSKLLTLSVTTNEEYGTFINKNGDTVKTVPAMLDGIPYSDAKAGAIRFAAVKKNSDSVVACKISIILQRDSAKRGEEEILVKTNLFEILLGESKYFYLRSDGGKISLDSTSDPSYEPKINEDVWSSEPVSIANKGEAKAGKRLGVYWEKRKPDGTTLAAGMIRLIGRYWSADSTYRVNLTAMYNGTKHNLAVEVKKPSRLGNIHRRAKDVFDNEISIDDTCIVYGGKFGVPPHFLKSQISIESPTRSFAFSDGKHETGFSPSYRYEPYTTQFDLKKTMRQNPFYIVSASMPEPPPPDHRYVLYVDYVKQTPVTVWYFVENYSQLLDPSKPAVFGMRVADGRMRFDTVGYRYLQREFDKLFNYFLNPLGGSLGLPQVLSVAQAADSARAQFASFLKTRWHGRLDSLYAQTRVAASYGLFQTLYSTALDRSYLANAEHLPEDLNVPDTCFPLSVRYQNSLMKAKKALGDKFECGNNWPKGFEASFRDYVYYPKWNLDSTYARKVSSNFSKYLPKK